jgi:hypothetical protein
MAFGQPADDAERAAVDAFGDAGGIADAFNQQGGAMPSRFTRWAALAGMLALPTLAVSLAFHERAKVGLDGDPPPNALMPIAFLMLLAGLAALIVRTHGSFGRTRGVIATVLIVAGLCLAPVGYGLVGVVASGLLIVGFGLLFDVIYREAVLPRPATALFVVSIVGLSLMAPTPIEKQSLPYYIGATTLLVGWMWLLYTLWSERPERAAVST